MNDEANLPKRMRLLDRIKKNIVKRTTQSKEEVQQESDANIEQETVLHGKEQAVYSNMLELFNNSISDNPLYKLWKAWKSAEDPNKDIQEWEQNQLLDIIFDKEENKDIFMNALELETEKQLAWVKLLVKAQKQCLLQFPHEGEKSPDSVDSAAGTTEELGAEAPNLHLESVKSDHASVPKEVHNEISDEIPDVDADIFIHIAQNHMAAWAFVFPPSGNGKPLQRPQVELALVEYMVSAGIDHAVIDTLIENPIYFRFILIAKGTPMVPGKDAILEEKFARNPDRVFGMDENGKVDYRVQNSIQIVNAGDVICELTPAVPGTDGIDVLGTVFPATTGKELKLTAGKNTKLNEEKTQLTAGITGHLHYIDGNFAIVPIYYVDGDVDLKIGNIDFLGDVYITGNVREDFVIHATGTVTIEGLVEGAMIESDKDILITNGILGENKAVLKAGGIIRAEYIENCVLYAGQEVQASSIITSFVYCDDTIRVTAGRGTIIGGKMVAGKHIDAKVIGCAAERNTVLSVGELPFVKKQREDFAAALVELEKEAEEVGRTAKFLTEVAGDNPEKLQKAADFRLRRSVLSMQIAHIQKRLAELNHKDAYVQGGQITAEVIYPVTEINMQGFTKMIKEKQVGNIVHMEEDGIHLC